MLIIHYDGNSLIVRNSGFEFRDKLLYFVRFLCPLAAHFADAGHQYAFVDAEHRLKIFTQTFESLVTIAAGRRKDDSFRPARNVPNDYLMEFSADGVEIFGSAASNM